MNVASPRPPGRRGSHRQLQVAAGCGTAILVLIMLAAWRHHPSPTAAPRSRRALDAPPPALTAFVGVFTSASTPPSTATASQYDYAARRRALRDSWFPPTAAAMAALDAAGVRVRFVVGRPPTARAAAAVASEGRQYGRFLVVDAPDDYGGLPLKTAAFLAAALRAAPAYILKVDDDVFLRVDRVPAAVAQWRSLAGGAGADAVGCAKNGPVFADPALRWHEPAAPLLGPEYFTHFWGPAYALSARAAAAVVALASSAPLRHLANEDTTVGLWLLAVNGTRYYDDRRMCAPACGPSAVAVYDYPECAGLCDPVPRLAALAAECVGGGREPPLVPEAIKLDGL